MDIQHEQTDDEGNFFVEKEGRRVASMSYTMVDAHTMNIYHTGVDDELQGQHIGENLVQASVDYARNHHLKIEPSCSFAQTIFDKGNFDDVIA